LMLGLPLITWWRLMGWLAIGLLIYLSYGHRHSVVALSARSSNKPV